MRPAYDQFRSTLDTMTMADLASRVEALQASYLDQGVTFDIGGEERAFPLDILPRVIEQDSWSTIERGVQQRVRALEAFLADVYDAGQVFTDGVIPRRVIATSSHFHRGRGQRATAQRRPRARQRHRPDPRQRRRVPRARGQRAGPVRRLLRDDQPARDRRGAARDVRRTTGSVRWPATRSGCWPRCGRPPRPVSPTRPSWCSRPGVFNGAYFEHALLARTMGVELVEGRDLECRRGRVMMRTTNGPEPVHVIYRRVDDEFLDPVHFRGDSLLGCPGLIDAARSGQVDARQRGRQRGGRRQARLHLRPRPDPLLPRRGAGAPQRRHLATRRRRRPRGGHGPPRRAGRQAGRRLRAARASSSVRRRPGPSSTSCGPRCWPSRATGSPSPSSSSPPCRPSSTAGWVPGTSTCAPSPSTTATRCGCCPAA